MIQGTRAGLLRRAAALVMDLVVAVLPATLLAFLPGLMTPLDRSMGLITGVMVPLTLAALTYVYLGYAFLPNTYGRYVVGIRVVDAVSGQRPSLSQAVRRALTMGLWPIEAALIAFSPSRQRLGDRWAKTAVVRYQPMRSGWMRLSPVILGGGAAYALFLLTIPLINGRMEISQAAHAFVLRDLKATPRGAPRQVNVFDKSGTVTLQLLSGSSLRVHLTREDGRWKAQSADTIPDSELGRGFSVQRGSASVSAGL